MNSVRRLLAVAVLLASGSVADASPLPLYSLIGDLAFNQSPPSRIFPNTFGSFSLTAAELGSLSLVAASEPSPSLRATANIGPNLLSSVFGRSSGLLNYSLEIVGPSGAVPVLVDVAGAASGVASAGASFAVQSRWDLFDAGTSLAGDNIQSGQLTGSFSESFSRTVSITLMANQIYSVFMVADAGAAATLQGSDVSARAFVDPTFSFGPGVDPQLYSFSVSDGIGNATPTPVPEPGALTLLGTGLVATPFLRRRRKSEASPVSKVSWTRASTNQLRSILIASIAALLGVPQIVNADVVTDWNAIAVTTVSADRIVNRESRDMAMVHAAMFDAMNAIRPSYTPAMVSIRARGYASREAAAAQAAHDVLLALFPDQQANLDAALAASLAQIPDDDEHGRRPKYWGIVTGRVAASAVLHARQNDHAFDSVPFTPIAGNGEYQFTPGCNATNISVPGWGNVTPFTAPDPDFFPTAARPSLSDSEWLASLEEVRAYGASNSTVRTAEQLELGLFYIEPSLTSMNRLARELVLQEPVKTHHAAAAKQLLRHARLFAALNIAQADTYIRTWRVKYREHFWRPYTAINALYPGTNWTPARQTPCHPELYAAHGTLTPAGITAIQHYRRGDAIDITITSTSLPGATRSYTSLSQIIEDVNDARIYTGFHYRSTLVRSNALGIAVANWVNDHLMRVLPEGAFDRDDRDRDDIWRLFADTVDLDGVTRAMFRSCSRNMQRLEFSQPSCDSCDQSARADGCRRSMAHCSPIRTRRRSGGIFRASS